MNIDFNIKFTCFNSSSKGNCFLLEGFKTKILLETGISIKNISEKMNHELHTLDGVLVSHAHLDHNKSTKEIMSRGINTYALKETFDRHGCASHHRAKIIKPKHKNKEIPTYNSFEIGEFVVKPFDVRHDAPNVNYLIESKLSGERLLFVIDTYYVRYKFDNLTHICIESNYCEKILQENEEKESMHIKYSSRLWSSHMSLQRCVDYLLSNNLDLVKDIHLSHLSPNNSNGKYFKETVEKATGKEVHICPA